MAMAQEKFEPGDPDRPAKDGFNSGGCEWCVTHWGTKWPASDTCIDEGATDQKAVLHFSTTWSPPRPVIVAASAKFPGRPGHALIQRRPMAFLIPAQGPVEYVALPRLSP